MLFDTVSAIELTAAAAMVAAVLSFTLSNSVPGRLRAALAIAGWFVIVLLLGATQVLTPERGIGTPGLGLAVLIPIGVLCWVWLANGSARAAISRIPLPILIASNILRAAGVTFVLLYAAHRLPAPFAPMAGWNDIVVGATAGPVAWLVARNGVRARPVVFLWNAFGVLDLVAAIGLGATSAPGPLRLFMGSPSTQMMTTLPWIIIPCFLVPSFLALHLAIFARMRTDARAAANQSILRAATPAVAR